VKADSSVLTLNPTRPTSWRFCLVAGALHALINVLVFPPYDLWILVYLSPLPLVVLALRTTSPLRSFLSVWLTSFLSWLWIHHWIADVSVLGYPFLAAYQGFWPALFVWLLAAVSPHSRLEKKLKALRTRVGTQRGEAHRILTLATMSLPSTLLVPILWVGVEYFRGHVFLGGYPWFMLGHPLIHAPVLCQIADFGGAYGVSFVAATGAGLIADLLTLPLFRRGRLTGTIKLSFAFFVILQAGTVGYGMFQLSNQPDGESTPSITVTAVQTNLPIDNKTTWSIKEQVDFFQQTVELTRLWTGPTSEPGGVQPDLIVWPETMVPGLGLNPEALSEIRRFETETNIPVTGDLGGSGLMYHRELARLAADLRTPLLVGATAPSGLTVELATETNEQEQKLYRIEPTNRFTRNSVYLYGADGRQDVSRYDKLVLTPFGEVIPVVYRWPDLQNRVVGLGAEGMKFNLRPGDRPVRFEVTRPEHDTESDMPLTFVIATPICFESTSPDACRRLVWGGDSPVRPADLLINVTNDGWFGSSTGGRAQHLQIGRFRCIENRKPMVRAANTGISAAIDSSGYVLVQGPTQPGDGSLPTWNSEGVMTATIQLDSRRTLYATVGDLLALLCLIGTLAACLLRIARWR